MDLLPITRQGYRVVPLDESHQREILDLDGWAFPMSHDVDDLLPAPSPFTWSRVMGVRTEAPGPETNLPGAALPATSPLVGMHASYPFARCPVPGATVGAAGLTAVGVHPAHRRRGILRAMIGIHFDQCRERGEAISILTAAEAAIYGRFGYGQSTQDVRLGIPRGAELREVPGAKEHTVRIEHASQARHGGLVAALHRRAGDDPTGRGGPLNRPGWVTRETPELEAFFWQDLKKLREGRESRRIVIVELDGEPRGYALFRRTLSWERTGPTGTVSAGEVVALDGSAARALWAVLTDLDLMGRVEPLMVPRDDAIMSLLVDPRAATPALADNIWTRLVDVPAALAGRRYASDVDAVLEVTDTLVSENEGRWHLRANAFAEAQVTATDARADVSLDVRDLGAAYLGGVSLASMATAGLVREHTPGTLASVAAAFGWPVAPVCSWGF